MAYNPNRLSTMTSVSNVSRPGGGPQSAQVSTQTLLNALHNAFLNSRPHALEFSTSLAVNTWVTDQHISPDGRVGGVVDQEFADRTWQHARRRAEDGTVVLG
jgi:chitin synthase